MRNPTDYQIARGYEAGHGKAWHEKWGDTIPPWEIDEYWATMEMEVEDAPISGSESEVDGNV